MIDFRFYLVTNRNVTRAPLTSIVSEACATGVRCVQIREKDLDAASLRSLVADVRGVCADTRILVNRGELDDTSLFEICDTGVGVHLPEVTSLPEGFRERYPDAPVGASVHSVESARAAARVADFLTFGPVFDTPAKRGFGPPQGLEALAEVAQAVDIPVFAIGGVTPENAHACLDAGACGIAVMGAVMSTGDVRGTIGEYAEAMGGL